jgi:predicted nucleic acid-binding protein
MDEASAGRGRRRLARGRRRGRPIAERLAFAEIRLGIERLSPGARPDRLAAWLDHELAERFEGRIIAIDPRIAKAWGQVGARGRAAARPPPVLDAFLAATALVH